MFESLPLSASTCHCLQVRRLKLSMQYRETHNAHEGKKREKEFERLKEKLAQVPYSHTSMYTNLHSFLSSPNTSLLLYSHSLPLPPTPSQHVSSRSQDRRLEMNVLNVLQRSDGKRRVWSKPDRCAGGKRQRSAETKVARSWAQCTCMCTCT